MAKTQEYDAYQGFLEAVRDYWLARVELTRLVGSRLPSDHDATRNTPSVGDILHTGTPPPAAAGHAGHTMSAAPDMGTTTAGGHAGHMVPPDGLSGDEKTGKGAGAPPPSPTPAEHVGHDMPAVPAPDHSGHMMPVAPAPDAATPAKQKPIEPAPALSPDATPEHHHHHQGGQL